MPILPWADPSGGTANSNWVVWLCRWPNRGTRAEVGTIKIAAWIIFYRADLVSYWFILTNFEKISS